MDPPEGCQYCQPPRALLSLAGQYPLSAAQSGSAARSASGSSTRAVQFAPLLTEHPGQPAELVVHRLPVQARRPASSPLLSPAPASWRAAAVLHPLGRTSASERREPAADQLLVQRRSESSSNSVRSLVADTGPGSSSTPAAPSRPASCAQRSDVGACASGTEQPTVSAP